MWNESTHEKELWADKWISRKIAEKLDLYVCSHDGKPMEVDDAPYHLLGDDLMETELTSRNGSYSELTRIYSVYKKRC